MQTITLGGGCFWCLEAVFLRVRGVLAVESGYCNGHVPSPTYEAVCSGTTGHAEVVQVDFDPSLLSLEDLLGVFFAIHDPTTLNRQGHDVGSQYRSGIYWSDAAQGPVIDQVRAQVDAALGGRVVTEVLPRTLYSRAEEDHQRYFEQHPHQGYCAHVVAPKVAGFARRFAHLLQA